jgi:hypothetical protein
MHQAAQEHRDVGADDHPHGGHRRDHAAPDPVDHPATLGRDQQRQHELDHRADKTPVGVLAEPADPLDRGEALLDEERGDEAPGDEGGDVRHDHAGQEGPELLHGDPRVARPAGARRARSNLGVRSHVCLRGPSGEHA